MSVDLHKLQKQLDDALENETKESFKKWYDEQNYDNSMSEQPPFELFYAELDSKKDVELFTFKSLENFLQFVDEIYQANMKMGVSPVYLLAHSEDIYVSEDLKDSFEAISSKCYNYGAGIDDDGKSIEEYEWHDNDLKFHIHEYESYESAYSVALSMREPNPKCYDQ